MPLRRPLPKRPKQSRLQTAISGAVHEQVDLYCAHYGITESAFFEAAALEKIGGTGQAKQIFARFNEQRRIAVELKRHVEIFAELLSFHVQYSLRTTPPLPKAELQETRRHGDALYRSLIQRIGENLSSRRGFFESFPSESSQNDAAVEERTAGPEADGARAPRTSDPRHAPSEEASPAPQSAAGKARGSSAVTSTAHPFAPEASR
jgi:hypothetical protein